MNLSNNPILAIVANKNDLYDNRQVFDDEGIEFADEIGAIFQTVSAYLNKGISELFENIGRALLIPGYANKFLIRMKKKYSCLPLSKYINM